MLSDTEVRHIATLARIGVTDAEVAKLQSDMSVVLDFFGALQAADTAGVEPVRQITGAVDHVRADVAVPAEESVSQRVVRLFPAERSGKLRVPTVLS